MPGTPGSGVLHLARRRGWERPQIRVRRRKLRRQADPSRSSARRGGTGCRHVVRNAQTDVVHLRGRVAGAEVEAVGSLVPRYPDLASLAAADGRWEEAEAKLLAHSECLRKAVTHSRLLLVHLVAKGILADTLNTLAVVMNLEGCPERFFRAILGRIPEANIAALGSETAFKADYLAFADYIEKRHFSLSDHWLGRLLGALFLQENRTKGYLHRPYADAIALEKIPPHRWKTNAADWGKRYGRSRQGLLWWIQNPVGKSVADTAAITNLRSVVHKSYNLIAIVDLLRISAEFRLRDDGTTPVETLLEDLTAYRRKDPYSGRSYGWNGERGVLYSHGPDLDDDRGLRSYLPDRDGDLILPVRLQRDPGRGGANPAPEE